MRSVFVALFVSMLTAGAFLALPCLCNPVPTYAQGSGAPPELLDWQVERTADGFQGSWTFRPQVHLYFNLYRRPDGANVASGDLGLGTSLGDGSFRYTVEVSSPGVAPDQEYTLVLTARSLDDPPQEWRFTFLLPRYEEGEGLFSGLVDWLRRIRDALNPLEWVEILFRFAIALAGRAVNGFLCEVFSWATGQRPETCIG